MLEWLTSLFGTSEAAWEDAVRRFMNSAQALEDAEQAHLAVYQIAQDLGGADLDQWNSLQDRILYTKQAVTDVTDKLRQGSQWFRQTFGLSALSVIPLVPLAVITGSISAVVAIVYAVKSYNDNVRAKWEYINQQKLPPDQARAILESSPVGTGLGAGFSQATTAIVIGGVILLALPSVLKAMREKS